MKSVPLVLELREEGNLWYPGGNCQFESPKHTVKTTPKSLRQSSCHFTETRERDRKSTGAKFDSNINGIRGLTCQSAETAFLGISQSCFQMATFHTKLI